MARATRLADITVRNLENSATITRLPLNQPFETQTYASIGRAALLDALHGIAEQHPNIEMVANPATAIHEKDGVVRLVLEGGAMYRANALIGADGQFGHTRQYVLSHDSAYVKGANSKIAMRLQIPGAALPSSFSQPSSNLWLGDGIHIVHYPIGDMVNIVVTLPSLRATHGWAQRLFPSHSPLACLADSSHSWMSQPLPKATATSCWRRGNVVLAGDAAHVMPPHLAQGAGQSLQDAASLLHHLHSSSLGTGLSAYARERSGVVARIAQKAEISGVVMGLNGTAARLRNMVLDLGGNSLMRGWLSEVWAGDPDLGRG